MAKTGAARYRTGMSTFTVTGMTCANCLRKVETTLQSLSPEIRVTLDPPRAVAPASFSADALNSALEAVGRYRVSEAAPPSILPQALSAWLQTYYPLLLIIGLIGIGSLAGGGWMLNFMAGLFIVFGAFKLLDVPAFAKAYARYDIVAKAFGPWAYAYPFIELGIGLAFLFRFQLALTIWLALILSLIGAIGVVQSVLRKETIQCACLGSVFKLPMSTVTIIEDLGMAAMAGWMLFAGA